MLKNKTFCFIDRENTKSSLRILGYNDLDYEKIFDLFKNRNKFDRIYLYTAEAPNQEDKRRNDYLEKLGYIVRRKRVTYYEQEPKNYVAKCPRCANEFIHKISVKSRPKANCDVELTLDIINQSNRGRCNKVVIFSGDGDFASVYEYLVRDKNPSIEVIVYAPLGKDAKYRTSTKLKSLNREGIIKIIPLETLNKHYAKR